MAHGAKGVGHGAEGIECGLRPGGDIGAYAPEGSGNREECGLRPLRALGSIYEPEAVGDIGAYAPEGSGNAECGNLRQRESKAD